MSEVKTKFHLGSVDVGYTRRGFEDAASALIQNVFKLTTDQLDNIFDGQEGRPELDFTKFVQDHRADGMDEGELRKRVIGTVMGAVVKEDPEFLNRFTEIMGPEETVTFVGNAMHHKTALARPGIEKDMFKDQVPFAETDEFDGAGLS